MKIPRHLLVQTPGGAGGENTVIMAVLCDAGVEFCKQGHQMGETGVFLSDGELDEDRRSSLARLGGGEGANERCVSNEVTKT